MGQRPTPKLPLSFQQRSSMAHEAWEGDGPGMGAGSVGRLSSSQCGMEGVDDSDRGKLVDEFTHIEWKANCCQQRAPC